MRNLAIITARSGSKGLKDKNIKPLNGKPLIAYSIDEAERSGIFSHIIVSTDSEKYAQIAREYGAEVPFLRSTANSGDNAGSWDVVREVLGKYADMGLYFDTVCLLQPTSPLRKAEDIAAGYRELKAKNADAITSVCEVDHSPLWTMTLDEDLSLAEYRKHSNSAPRQMLSTYYRLNGALFIRRVEYDSGEVRICDKREYALIMERNRSVDIDSIDDFEYVEYLMGKQNEKS
jgi:CMP-N,N'-diacetyllegionaminic acid synthase